MSGAIEEISSITGDKKLSSGLEGLDFQLGGGIPAGSMILLFGGPLTGIEKLALQFWRADESGESTYFMNDTDVLAGMTDSRNMSPAEIIGAMRGKWIVVDSLSTLIIKYGVEAVLEFLREASEKIHSEGANLLLIMYDGIHDPYIEVMVKRTCNTVFTIEQFKHGNEIERNLQVNKIKGLDVPRRVYPYNILEKGIELSTTGRVV